MTENTERSEPFCPKCGNTVRRNEGGLYICSDNNCRWRGYNFATPPQPSEEKEGKPGVVLTSGQIYRGMLEGTFGFDSEKNVYRVLKRLGDIQVEPLSSDIISLTLYPGGGCQRIPLVQGTVKLDIKSVQEIHLAGKFPHATVDINPGYSGQPITVNCYIKS